MNIALTGATGFLGRHVAEALVAAGHLPVLLVRGNRTLTGFAEDLPVVRFDLHDPPSDAFLRLGNPDLVIHLAWDGLPDYRSLHHMETELPAQYAFLRALVYAGLPKLLVSGSCFEYGMQSGCLTESTTTHPSNPYGFAKDALRRMLEFLSMEHYFDFTWCRLFYLHGEGQSALSLLPQLHAAVERGEEIFEMSGGEQLRDFLPARKASSDLVNLALSPGGHGIVNLCSGTPVSVRALVENWIRENNWNIRPLFGHYPYPDYEPLAFWGSREKLDSILVSV